MAEHVFQCVWPIVDPTLPAEDLLDEAAEDLEGLAERSHVLITGPAVWTVRPAAQVLGWQAYAPGNVLICWAPAESVKARKLGRGEVDRLDVEAAVSRNMLPPRRADRSEAVRWLLVDQGLDAATVASKLGMKAETVERAVSRVRKRAAAVA